MKVDDSILESVRGSLLGSEDNDEFDNELLPYINSSIFNLNQNGVGAGIIVVGVRETWSDLMGYSQLEKSNSFKSVPLYIHLHTKLLFDPPPPSNVQYNDKIVNEMLWRLKVEFEEEEIKPDVRGSKFNKKPWYDKGGLYIGR